MQRDSARRQGPNHTSSFRLASPPVTILLRGLPVQVEAGMMMRFAGEKAGIQKVQSRVAVWSPEELRIDACRRVGSQTWGLPGGGGGGGT